MPDLSDTVAKCRMGTAKKFYTSIASLSHTSKRRWDETCLVGQDEMKTRIPAAFSGSREFIFAVFSVLASLA